MADTDSHVQQDDLNYKSRTNSGNATPAINNYFGNNSFSGSDMVAIMHITGIDGVKGTYTLGSLQTLSYSTSMQRMPVRSIGNVNAKDYVMGQRTIAGSLVFAVFDKHFAYEAMKAIKGITEEDYHFLADELPAFDITITFANEYGKIAKLAIYGVRLVNEGQVMSINDIYTENTYQYVATDIDYLSDQTTNTSGLIYEPLKPNPNSVSEPVEIEDIIIEETNEDEEDISKYQIVYVKTKDAYVEDAMQVPGRIELDLYKRVDYGTLSVKGTNNTFEKNYELTTGVQFPIIDETIPEGAYEAKYFSGKSFSRTTAFIINNKKTEDPMPAKPIIVLEEKVADGTFTIGVQAVDEFSKGIQYTTNKDSDDSWITIEPPNPYSVIKGLKAQTTYYFRAYNASQFSAYTSCYTDEKKEHLFSDFKDYIDANKSYLIVEWPYFEKMWDSIYAAWLVEPTGSVCVALEKCKNKLNLSSKESLAAYNRLCEIAANYEKNQIAYVSQKTKIKAPVIVKMGQRIIEFERNVSTLEITCVSNGFKTVVQLLSFQVINDKYRYIVNSKYTGMHQIIAKDSTGNHSPALVLYVPEKTAADAFIEKEMQAALNNELELKEASKGLNTTLVGLSPNNKEQLLKELNQSNKNVKTKKITAPEIFEINETFIKIKCPIPSVYTSKFYLCLCPTDDLGVTLIKQRIAISGSNFEYTLYPPKHILIDKGRYSMWVEDDQNEVVSETTSFNFDQLLSTLQIQKNSELLATVKSYLKSAYTKESTHTYQDKQALTASGLFQDIFYDTAEDGSLTADKKDNYLYEIEEGYNKCVLKNFSYKKIENLIIYPFQGYATGDFSKASFDFLAIKIPDIESRTYRYGTGDYVDKKKQKVNFVPFNNFSEYAILSFENSAEGSHSPIIFLDLRNRKVYGLQKDQKVVW